MVFSWELQKCQKLSEKCFCYMYRQGNSCCCSGSYQCQNDTDHCQPSNGVTFFDELLQLRVVPTTDDIFYRRDCDELRMLCLLTTGHQMFRLL